MTPLSRVVNNKNNKSTKFYFACIVRCIGLCYYYQGEHNNSESCVLQGLKEWRREAETGENKKVRTSHFMLHFKNLSSGVSHWTHKFLLLTILLRAIRTIIIFCFRFQRRGRSKRALNGILKNNNLELPGHEAACSIKCLGGCLGQNPKVLGAAEYGYVRSQFLPLFGTRKTLKYAATRTHEYTPACFSQSYFS